MSKIDVDFREQEDVRYELTYARDGITMSVYSKTGDKVNIHLNRKQFNELDSRFQFRLPQQQMPDDTMTQCGIKGNDEPEDLKLQVLAQNPQLLDVEPR